ncbi:hypothetical protein [Sanguibacter antarcticus]|nr:hypothetical protein [Sanguibacter antarcticus]
MPRRPGPLSPTQLSTAPLPAVHLARDFTAAHVRSCARDGTWIRVRPGAYLSTTEHPASTRDRDVALSRMIALARQSTVPLTFSHISAALLWGLPMVPGHEHTHVVQGSRPGTRGDRGVVRHRTTLHDEHRTRHNGLIVTTLERTVVDCLRMLPPLSGLIIADAALHVGADRTVCSQMLEQLAGSRGIIKAREVLALADEGAESPGETTVRFAALRMGLPVPETQIKVVTSSSTYWADLGWRGWRLLVEYDGRQKYADAATDVLLHERRRQESVEDAGWHVVRVMKEDLRTPGLLRRRLLRHVPTTAHAHLSRRPVLNSR